MSAPQQQWLPPQQTQQQTHQPQPAPDRRGLPGWAIALIAVLGVGALAVLMLGITFLVWFGSFLTSIPNAIPSSPPVPSMPGEPLDELDLDEVPEMDPHDPTPGDAAPERAARGDETYDTYLAAAKDGSSTTGVPGGDAVDPKYFTDFLYLLTDLKGATAFLTDDDTEAIADIGEKADELERRFLAGEDLGSSVKITRSDGTVYESDGKYRLRE